MSIQGMAQDLANHIKKESSERWPGATLLTVIDGSGQHTDGYVWCDLAGSTVRCITPTNVDLSGGSHIIYAIPTGDGPSSDYIFIGASWNGLDDGRIPRTRTTEIQSGSDLRITCGSGHTYTLTNTVYNDLQFAVSQGKIPASNAPNWEALTANTFEYAFDVDEYIDLGAQELPHGWKEGTSSDIHLHCAIKAANSSGSSQYAKFTVYIASANYQAVWAETTLTAELTVPDGAGALQSYYLDLGDLSLTNNILGTMIKVRIKRIAATGGTEYASSMFIGQVGAHLQYDTMGSRLETSK
jgi:hypothetical protein